MGNSIRVYTGGSSAAYLSIPSISMWPLFKLLDAQDGDGKCVPKVLFCYLPHLKYSRENDVTNGDAQ